MTPDLVRLPRHLKISSAWHGLTVYEAIRRAFPEIGPRDAFRKARLGEILRNDLPCHPLERLAHGDVVTVILLRPRRPSVRAPLRRDEAVATRCGPFRIVWEDEDLLAVSKPPGCASHPALGHAGDTLIERVRAYLGVRPGDSFQPALANRLDLETSGIVLVAKTRSAQRVLGRHFQKGLVGKLYLALVAGWPLESGEIAIPLPKHPDSRTRSATAPARGGGSEKIQPACTRYRVARRMGHPLRAALLEVDLLTGRTHQIRRHLARLGHPLAGDWRYGDAGFNGDVQRFGGLGRMFLHAHRVRLSHPATGQPMDLRTSLPDDLASCLEALGGGKATEAQDG